MDAAFDVFSDSILRKLPGDADVDGTLVYLRVQALAGATIGRLHSTVKKKLQSYQPDRDIDGVVLHVGTNSLSNYFFVSTFTFSIIVQFYRTFHMYFTLFLHLPFNFFYMCNFYCVVTSDLVVG